MSNDLGEDPFEHLGVHPEANEKEVRRAFYRKARELHPDVNAAADAEERFKHLLSFYQKAVENRRRRGPRRQRARPASVRRAPSPPPARFHCPACGERYEQVVHCFRCDLPLWDGHGQPPRCELSPAALALEAKLASRKPSEPRPHRLKEALSPLLLTTAFLLSGLFFFFGPLGMALLMTSYTAFIALIAAHAVHRQRTLQRLGFAWAEQATDTTSRTRP